MLFGPVSITDNYTNISKDLMVQFFQGSKSQSELAPLVRAKRAPKNSHTVTGSSLRKLCSALTSADAVSAVISGFETDKKGLPVLLKHYLKLNGTLLSFNVDPAFKNAIDGLILVDLTKADGKILSRYFGREGYQRFMEFQRSTTDCGVRVV